MTPTKLPELLAALAERLPERFETADAGNGDKFYYAWRGAALGFTGHFAHVYTHSTHPALLNHDLGRESALILEDALREECVALGWGWSIQTNLSMGKPYEACIAWNDSYGEGDTPAEALCKAMLDALENVE